MPTTHTHKHRHQKTEILCPLSWWSFTCLPLLSWGVLPTLPPSSFPLRCVSSRGRVKLGGPKTYIVWEVLRRKSITNLLVQNQGKTDVCLQWEKSQQTKKYFTNTTNITKPGKNNRAFVLYTSVVLFHRLPCGSIHLNLCFCPITHMYPTSDTIGHTPRGRL